MVEEFLLEGRGIVHLRLHCDIYLLPEARHTAHTGRMHLSHTLLNLVRISIDEEACALAQTEISPSTLEDVGERKEVDDTILLRDRHTLIVGLQGCMILSVGEHHALAVAGGTAGIEDVRQVVHRGLLIEFLHLRLAWQVLTQLDKVLEVKGVRVMSADAHTGVEDDDAL